jgi:cobalamin biosynthesis Mg chelatase CobN
VKAHQFFSDPEWDGEPEEVTVAKPGVVAGPTPEPPEPPPAKIVVKLADGKARTIQSTERASSKRSHLNHVRAMTNTAPAVARSRRQAQSNSGGENSMHHLALIAVVVVVIAVLAVAIWWVAFRKKSAA